jgi:hypothetical protein
LASYVTGAVTDQFSYEANRPKRIWTTGGFDALDLFYTYDSVGNVVSIADPRPNAIVGTTSRQDCPPRVRPEPTARRSGLQELRTRRGDVAAKRGCHAAHPRPVALHMFRMRDHADHPSTAQPDRLLDANAYAPAGNRPSLA